MTLFAEAQRLLSRIYVLRSGSNSLTRGRCTRRSQSLNNEFSCQAIVPYSTQDRCVFQSERHDLTDVKCCTSHHQESAVDNGLPCDRPVTTSVRNLQSFLAILPKSSEELSRIIDDICAVEGTHKHGSASASKPIIWQDTSRLVPRSRSLSPALSVVQQTRHLVDGIYLDKLYDIDKTPRITDVADKHHNTEPSSQTYKPVGNSQQNMGNSRFSMVIISDNQDTINDENVRQKFTMTQRMCSVHSDSHAGLKSYAIEHIVNCSANHVFLCDNATPSRSSDSDTTPTGDQDNPNLPSREQLDRMRKYLAEYMPLILKKSHPIGLYSADMIFENNFVEKPYVTKGVAAYVMFTAKVRAWVHFKYANVQLHLMKITDHIEDGTIRIRWRVTGLPQLTAFKFWKFLPWTYRATLKEEAEWLDGFSTFYVEPEKGCVYKHRMDKVMPDEEPVTKKSSKEKLVEKIRGGLNVGTV